MTEERSRARVEWVDIARGIGIVAVVVWHVAGGLVRAGITAPAGTEELVLAWDTYALRLMPIFFLVSGAMLGTAAERPTQEVAKHRAKLLLWPYLVWSVISLVGGSLAGGATNAQFGLRDLPRIIYDPVLQFWFLPALLVITIAWLGMRRAGISAQILVALAALLSVAATAAGNETAWYFGRQLALFAAYFAVGAVLGRPFVDRVAAAPRKPAALVGAASAAVVMVAIVAGPAEPWFPIAVMTAVLSTASVVALAASLAGTWVGRLGVTLGRASLEIYVVHVIAFVALRTLLVRFGGVDSFLVHFIAGVVVGLSAGLLLARVSRHRGFGWLVRLPAHRHAVVATGVH